MRKLALIFAAALMLVACTKEHAPLPDGTVTIRFSPYEMAPMSKTTSSVMPFSRTICFTCSSVFIFIFCLRDKRKSKRA